MFSENGMFIIANKRAEGVSVVSQHNKLTSRRRVLEKLIATQLDKKFLSFYGSRSLLPCSQEPATSPYSSRCIQSTTFQTISL